MINKHRAKRAATDVREKKMNTKLTKMTWKLNAYKEENSQNNVTDKNVVIILSFASQNLSIDTINLIFQKKLNEIVLFIDEKKFLDASVFSKVKLDEWNAFKYAFHVKFQSASTRFASEKIKLRYASIKITDLINKIVAHRFYIQKS